MWLSLKKKKMWLDLVVGQAEVNIALMDVCESKMGCRMNWAKL